MRRIVTLLVVGYVSLALYYKAREAAGLLSCGLLPRLLVPEAGLSMFCWVFPRFHHNPGLEAWKKRQFESPA